MSKIKRDRISVPKYVDYRFVDWTRLDADLATELGVTRQAVNNRRRLLGIKAPNGVERAAKSKFAGVDWSKSDKEIAERLGLRINNVASKRPSFDTHAPADRVWLRANDPNIDWSKSNSVLAIELECSCSRISQLRKRLKKPARTCGGWTAKELLKNGILSIQIRYDARL